MLHYYYWKKIGGKTINRCIIFMSLFSRLVLWEDYMFFVCQYLHEIKKNLHWKYIACSWNDGLQLNIFWLHFLYGFKIKNVYSMCFQYTLLAVNNHQKAHLPEHHHHCIMFISCIIIVITIISVGYILCNL